MRTLYVFVYLPGHAQGVPAGRLEYDEAARVGAFEYGRLYRERRDAVAVDPVALPLHVEVHPPTSLNGGLYGAIRDAAPDYWGRLVMAAMRRVSAAQLGEIDYLTASNATRVGRLDFRDSPTSVEPAPRAPAFQQLEKLFEAARAVEAGRTVRADLMPLLQQGTTIGGSRPKCTVERDGALWIAKFPARDDAYNNARVEFATMTLAREAGIRVPEVKVIALASRDVLLVKRFDRQAAAGGYHRHAYLSALSLMQWDENDRHLFSYPALADQMRLIGCSRADLAELYVRMVFNILCRNLDDHPRNHAFIAPHVDYGLSPAYDLVPAPATTGVGEQFNLAMEVGGEGRLASIENARSSHARFGLTLADADSAIAKVKQTTSGWATHFQRCRVSAADRRLLRGSFENSTLLGDSA